MWSAPLLGVMRVFQQREHLGALPRPHWHCRCDTTPRRAPVDQQAAWLRLEISLPLDQPADRHEELC